MINQFGEKIVVTAKLPEDDVSKNVHAALYAKDGILLDYMIYPAEFSDHTVHFMFKKIPDSSYLRVFLWGGLETMTPLEDCVILNVQ